MNDARVWILTLATVSFFAGIAGGMMISKQGMEQNSGPMADYGQRFVERFELDPQRARLLRRILHVYEQEVAQVEHEHLAAYRSAMEPDLNELGSRYGHLVRDKVLPASKRPLFDQLSVGLPFTRASTH